MPDTAMIWTKWLGNKNTERLTDLCLDNAQACVFADRPMPSSLDESRFWLIDKIGAFGDCELERWRSEIFNMALDSPHSAASWADKYEVMTTDQTHLSAALWKAAEGVHRVCLVQPLHSDPKKADSDVEFIKRLDKLYEESTSSHSDSRHELLSFLQDNIKQNVRHWNLGNEHNLPKNEHEILIRFSEEVYFRVWFRWGFKEDVYSNNGLIERYKKIYQEWWPKKGSSGLHGLKSMRPPYFSFLLDTPGENLQLCAVPTIRYQYDMLAQTTSELNLGDLQYISGILDLYRGVVGLEGQVLLRTLPEGMGLNNEFQGYDRLWNGSGMLVWLITLFQRAAAESLAKEAISSARENMDFNHREQVREANIMLNKIEKLETCWMYRELSIHTDLDSLYRLYQKVFDVDEMWRDVREQSEMISYRVRAMQAELSATIVNLFTFLVIPATLFITILQIDPASVSAWQKIGLSWPSFDFGYLRYLLAQFNSAHLLVLASLVGMLAIYCFVLSERQIGHDELNIKKHKLWHRIKIIVSRFLFGLIFTLCVLTVIYYLMSAGIIPPEK